MSTTSERIARKPRPCGAYHCGRTIEPGQRYLRHVAFPGDDGYEEGTRPWVIDECQYCSDTLTDGHLSYIASVYKVPAARGGRVIFNGKPGVITGAANGYLLVRFDDKKRAAPCHPTWRMEYLSAVTS